MSNHPGNSFADVDDRNPFEDPAILEAMRSQRDQQVTGDFNAFMGPPMSQPSQQPASQAFFDSRPGASQTPAAAPTQPAVMQPTMEPPPPYSPNISWDNTAAAEELKRRQEELEVKAAELQRREDEIQRSLQLQARRNNFPPLPSSCPVQPCFYQDISVDIPLEFQKVVRHGFHLWMAYIALLSVNVIGSLTYFVTTAHNGLSNNSGVTFGMSIFYLILFTPCSFVCWFRPLYKAFRSDSSFNFFVFFFIFFFQFCVSIMQSLGIDGWGTVGFITSLAMFSQGAAGATAAAVIMILIGLLFAGLALLDLFILFKVHRIYRSTGASFAKAQQEFAHDVMGNRTMQQAAGNFAASAARSSVEQSWSNNRY